MHLKTYLVCSAIALGASCAGARAQTVEEIVVTAQKRAENVQDVPISIVAVSAQMAKSSGVKSTEDLSILTPGLNFSRVTSSAVIFMRGVGTAGVQAGNDNAIATFVDGIYMPGQAASIVPFNNIERVEVLKGPQGTLFGRNASGGAINVITRTPSYDTKLEADFGYGNKETIEANIYGTQGLSDVLAADLAVHYLVQNEGFGTNLTTGEDVNKQKELLLRSKLLFEPGDNTRVVLAGDYAKTKSDMGVTYRPGPATFTSDGAFGWSHGHWDSTQGQRGFSNLEQGGLSLRWEQDLSWGDFLSLSSWRKSKLHQGADVDLIAAPIIDFTVEEKGQNLSQEFQLKSKQDGTVTWIVGVYAFADKTEYSPFALTGTGLGGLDRLYYDPDYQKTLSLAVFGQSTIRLTERLRATLGLRYTVDRRKYHVEQFADLPDGTVLSLGTINEKKTFKKVTWRAGLDYDFADDIMGYATVSRGFKSGIFNLSSPNPVPIKPEVLDAYEIGLKSTLFDRRLRLNVAGFYYKYDNIQLAKIDGPTQILLNAASARLYGIDADFQLAVTERLSVSGGGEWLHAKYDTFLNAPLATPNPNFPYGNIQGSVDASDNDMIRAPDWTASVAVDYHAPLAGGEFGANISYYYNDGYFFEADNRLRQKAYSLVNAQLRWTAPEDRYQIRLWSKNLFNEKYYGQGTESGLGDLVSAAPGRTFGVTLGFTY